LSYPKHGGVPWYATGGAILSCILLIGIPKRRRNFWNALGMLVMLITLASGMIACGGGGGGGGTTHQTIPGTTAGSYTVTVTGTGPSGTPTANIPITFTVQ
jgi:hypothetical protein